MASVRIVPALDEVEDGETRLDLIFKTGFDRGARIRAWQRIVDRKTVGSR